MGVLDKLPVIGKRRRRRREAVMRPVPDTAGMGAADDGAQQEMRGANADTSSSFRPGAAAGSSSSLGQQQRWGSRDDLGPRRRASTYVDGAAAGNQDEDYVDPYNDNNDGDMYYGDDDAAAYQMDQLNELAALTSPRNINVDDDADLPYAVDEPKGLAPRTCCKFGAVVGLIVAAALLGFGIAMVVASDSARPAEERYQAAVAAFNNGPRSALALWNGSLGGALASEMTEQLQGVDGAPSAVSVFYSAVLLMSAARWSSAVNLSVSFNPGPNFIVPGLATSQVVSAASVCERASCSSLVDNSSTTSCTASTGAFICSAASLGSACRASFGASATYTGLPQCVEAAPCGSCAYPGFLQSLCVVVRSTANARIWELDTSYASCEYPFTSHNYSWAAPATLRVDLRVSTDPYLVLERETLGTGRFAAAPRSVSDAGVALIVLGSIGILASVGAAVYLVVKASGDDDEEQRQLDRMTVREKLKMKHNAAERAARRPGMYQTHTRALYEYESAKLQVRRETGAAGAVASERRPSRSAAADGDGAAIA